MATWFARQSSVDINASNVWNAAADGSGAWLTWASLGASDVLVANGYTDIAINVDFTCGTITNASTYGGTAGGQFTVSTVAADRTITADIVGQNTGTSTGACVKATLSSTYRLTIDGDVTGGGVANGHGMDIWGAGAKLTVTGTVTGGTNATAAYGVAVYGDEANITLNNVTGGTTGTVPAAYGIWDGQGPYSIITLTGIASSPDKCRQAISTNGCVVMKPGASLVSNKAFWMFPISGRIKWETTDTGIPITLYDAAGGAHVLKVPDYPAEEDVEASVDYDYGDYTGTLSASCDYPAEADVQSGVSFGSGVYTGTFTAPAVGDVQAGVTYGGGGTEYEGTFAVPSVGDVATGVGYGAGGTEFEGTLEISGLSETQMEAILDARGLTEPASDTADSVARRGASAVTLSDVGSGGGAMHSTTIATLASQTSFTLTAGSADDDAYNYCVAVITDESTDAQKCVAVISDYTGASKTVTLGADPAIFAMAVGDTVEIYPPAGLRWINGAVASGSSTVKATMAAGAITSDAFAAGAIDAGAIADGAIDAATFAADVDDEVRAWIVDNSTGDGVRIDSAALNTCTGVTIPAIKDTVDSLSSGVTVSDKTGFKLASDGLDAIATTAPSGPATTFREMVVQTWRWFFKRATKTSESLVTYADDGTTPITTQAITASGTHEERGAAT